MQAGPNGSTRSVMPWAGVLNDATLPLKLRALSPRDRVGRGQLIHLRVFRASKVIERDADGSIQDGYWLMTINVRISKLNDGLVSCSTACKLSVFTRMNVLTSTDLPRSDQSFIYDVHRSHSIASALSDNLGDYILYRGCNAAEIAFAEPTP